MSMTITEALAELKTIDARLEKKRSFVLNYLSRPNTLRDPLTKDGGSEEAVRKERQSIADLQNRVLKIRSAIREANMNTTVTIGDTTRTIEEWLTWKKDVAPNTQRFLTDLNSRIQQVRTAAQQQGRALATNANEAKDTDVIINLDEGALAREAESMEEVLGVLDGQLSLRNATVVINV